MADETTEKQVKQETPETPEPKRRIAGGHLFLIAIAVVALALFVALIAWISLGAKVKDEKKKTGLKEIKVEIATKFDKNGALCTVTLPKLARETKEDGQHIEHKKYLKLEGEEKKKYKEVVPQLELVRVEAGKFTMSSPVTKGRERNALKDSKHGREVFMDPATGRCVLFDAKTGKYTDAATGKPVSGDMVFDARTRKYSADAAGVKVKDWKKLYTGNEVPHVIELKNDFYIGKTEVTQQQWMAVMGVKDNGAEAGKAKKSYFPGADNPVEMVTWNEAMLFCDRLNKGGFAPEGWMFTLPTETQWEFAARGGKLSKGFKYSGGDTLGNVAWCKSNAGDDKKNHPVAKKAPNELGLYDMNGNVWEWCLDDFEGDSSQCVPEFTREVDSETGAVKGRSSAFRAMRGGSWYTEDEACTPSVRSPMSPAGYGLYLGFRVALVKKPAPEAKADEKKPAAGAKADEKKPAPEAKPAN